MEHQQLVKSLHVFEPLRIICYGKSAFLTPGREGGRGYSSEFLVGVCHLVLQILT